MIEVTDVLGRLHRFERPPRRVVSLVPSLTETLFELGAGDAVAGVTEFCIFPDPAVAPLPRFGGTKTPRVDEIRSLAPDLVYVNLEENLGRHAEAIAEFAPVFATEPKSVADVVDLIGQLGTIHDAFEAARQWTARIEEEARALAGNAPFRFACAIWKEPWMWCGGDTYVSDLVAAAGGRNVLAAESRYPRRTVDEIAALGPDVVFLPDEPYVFTAADAAAVRERFRVVGPFPGHLFTWHGTRTALGLRFLRDALR